MDFTDPFTGLTPERKLNREEILRALRLDLAAELDAINLYQAHIDNIDDERVREVIAHIRDEEKEHVSEFMEMINVLDPTQSQLFASEHAAAVERGQAGVLPMKRDVVEEMPEARPPTGGELTVGSLLGEEQT